MTAKKSQKVPKKAKENKKGVEPTNSQTPKKRRKKVSARVMSAKVTSIKEDGFWLRVRGTDYFMAFTHFPWFRYANDDDIKCIEVWHNDVINEHGELCGFADDHGEFWVIWPMLDIHLGTDDIKWHSENPIRYPHALGHPNSKGKLINRMKDESVSEKEYEVKAEFKYNCTFTITAESAEQAKQLIAQKCRMFGGGVKIDVQIPFNEIAWEFDRFRSDAEVKGKATLVKRETK